MKNMTSQNEKVEKVGNKIRKTHPPLLKKNVAIAMIKQQDTVSQICTEFSIHPSQAHAWKKIGERSIESGFSGELNLETQNKEKDEKIDELLRQVGKLSYEQEWLKKKLGYTN
jgi:transposase-like protein